MIQHKEHFHGSDLEKIEQIYGIKKEEITSFSANVNPLGISPLLRKTLADHIDAISTYPDREYTAAPLSVRLYRCQPGSHHCRERLHRADLFIHSDHASKKP